MKSQSIITPHTWIVSWASVQCPKCGNNILGINAEYEFSETCLDKAIPKHICSHSAERLSQIGEQMKAYRIAHPEATMDEQMELYSQLLEAYPYI